MFENVDIQHTHIPRHIHTCTHTHIRTTEAYLYYKLTNEAKGSGELKIEKKMSYFKSNESIHKKEDGSYYVVSANKASSVIL